MKAIENATLYDDNEISIALTKNTKSQHQTKHINIQHYYIRLLINKREFTIEWILESKILANRMTKFLPIKTFRKYSALLKMVI